jgi:biopolymer transport protein ExbB/TolQ
MRKFGFYFSELSVTVVIYSLLLWYFASKEYVFSSYNREISWLILLLSGVGIVIVIYHLRNLYREDQQISVFSGRLENFKIVMNQLLQKKYTLTSEMLANNLRKTVDEYFAILEASLLKEQLYKMLNMTLTASSPNQDALSHLLRRKIEVRGNRISYIAGISFMIGLLGTFLGFRQALKSLQHVLPVSESIDLTTLFAGMRQTLGGLDAVFAPIIVGITAYFVLAYLNSVLRIKQSYVLNRIEEVMLEHVMPAMQGFQAGETRDIPSAAIDALRSLPNTVADQLTTALTEIIQQTISESIENLKTTSIHLQYAAEGIQEGQGMFTEMLDTFRQFIATFQEGKEQLLSSQETLTSGIREFSQAIAMNRQVFERMEETIQSEYNTFAQIMQHLEEFLKTAGAESFAYFQRVQEEMNTIINTNTEISRDLLESHTMLTTLLYDMKTFILDEQKGLNILSNGLEGTFGEIRFQYLQLTEHIEELYKRLGDSRDQLAQVQETVTVIQQHL